MAAEPRRRPSHDRLNCLQAARPRHQCPERVKSLYRRFEAEPLVLSQVGRVGDDEGDLTGDMAGQALVPIALPELHPPGRLGGDGRQIDRGHLQRRRVPVDGDDAHRRPLHRE